MNLITALTNAQIRKSWLNLWSKLRPDVPSNFVGLLLAGLFVSLFFIPQTANIIDYYLENPASPHYVYWVTAVLVAFLSCFIYICGRCSHLIKFDSRQEQGGSPISKEQVKGKFYQMYGGDLAQMIAIYTPMICYFIKLLQKDNGISFRLSYSILIVATALITYVAYRLPRLKIFW